MAESVSAYNKVTVQRHPLLIDLILSKLFSGPILKFKDLKRCRLVCSKWENILRPVFREKARLVFRCAENDPALEIYQNLDHCSKLPFQAYRFERYIPWLFENIATENKKSITELHFKSLTGSGKYNLSSLFNLSPLIGPNISKLTVHYSGAMTQVSPVKVNLDLECLQSINYLSLTYCTVTLSKSSLLDSFSNKWVKISPKELLLEKVTFLQDGKVMRKLLVNDFVNFDKMTDLTLRGTPGQFELDICCDNAAINILKLSNVNVVNWNKQKWTVNKVHLECCARLRNCINANHEVCPANSHSGLPWTNPRRYRR